MYSSGLKSSWETSQRLRQKRAQKQESAEGGYNYGVNYSNFSAGKSLLTPTNLSTIRKQKLEDDEQNNYPELPNLKYTQGFGSLHNGARGGMNHTGKHIQNAGNSHEYYQPSGMVEKRENRKFRASSRQGQSSGYGRPNRRRYQQQELHETQLTSGLHDQSQLGSTARNMLGNTQQSTSLPLIQNGNNHNVGYSKKRANAGAVTESGYSTSKNSMGQHSQNFASGNHISHSNIPREVAASFSNNYTSSEEHQTCGVTSIKGLKPGNPNWNNQDNFFIQENPAELKLYCVLDGHGEHGHHISRRCREQFPIIIRSNLHDMTKAFLLMQTDLNNYEYDARCSGATCVLAVVANGRISVFNCGDSRAVLGRRNGKGNLTAHPLSKDHKPDDPDERKRVLQEGGHLGCRQVVVNQPNRGRVSMPVGPCRVWYSHRGETLGLAMSRSLGDTVVHKCGVSAEPDLMEHKLDEYDEFFVLATDGVWDVIDSNQAVQIIASYASKNPNWSAVEASNILTKTARGRWEKMSPMIDDITALVVKLS